MNWRGVTRVKCFIRHFKNYDETEDNFLWLLKEREEKLANGWATRLQ